MKRIFPVAWLVVVPRDVLLWSPSCATTPNTLFIHQFIQDSDCDCDCDCDSDSVWCVANRSGVSE